MIYNILKDQVEKNANGIAILSPGRDPLTYSNLLAQIDYILNKFSAMGLGSNDRIAIVLPNGSDMAVTFLAVAAMATSAPLNPSYRESEFEFYLSDLNAKALILQDGIDSPAEVVAKKRNIPVIKIRPEEKAGVFTFLENTDKSGFQIPLTPFAKGGIDNRFAKGGINISGSNDGIALVLHTSGTTSRPKIVPLTQGNICVSANNIRKTLKLTEKDRCLNVMPLFHIHGLIGALLSSLSAGASIVCTPGFYSNEFFGWMDEFQPTWYSAVPTMHQAILARAEANREIIARNPLRFVRSSSASLPPKVMAALEEVFNAPAIEAYGMTEAAHQMASNPLPPGIRKPGSVGLAAGPEVAIMDESGNLLTQGEIGEIVIRGENVTQGYENNPDANKKAFTNGWFRTGDQGYLDYDNYLFITGRIKELINRGGEKIAPREVDEVIMEYPGVAQAVAFAIPHPQLGEEVGAAVVLQENASVTEMEIQEFAAKKLADFKIPRRVVFLDEIPKGATGKLQRIGLAERLGLADIFEIKKDVEFVPPRTPIEEKLADIWSQLLEVEKIGIHDNFFELGGDSILMTRVISRVRSNIGARLSIVDFFSNPTIYNIARIIDTGSRENINLPIIEADSHNTACPLTSIQQGIWFMERLNSGTPIYNRPVFLRLKGDLNIPTLEKSLNEIIRRHQILRTKFPDVDGKPFQAVSPYRELKISIVNLQDLSELKHLATEEARKPFDFAKDLLLRATLYRFSEEDHLLLLTTHHIAFDAWSSNILLRELSILYEAFFQGKPSPLTDLPIQYSDFARWQSELLQGDALEKEISYWQEKLSEPLPLLQLPTDKPRPTTRTYTGAYQYLTLSPEISESLRNLSQKEGVTLFITLLAAFQTLLYRHTGQDDIIVGSPITGRNQFEIEDLIGPFINNLVMRTDFSDSPTFRELLSHVKETALGAYAHQDMPFGELVNLLNPKRDFSGNPIFQAMFNLENIHKDKIKIAGLDIDAVSCFLVMPASTATSEFRFENGISLFDINLEVLEEREGLFCSFNYNPELFHEETIQRFINHFETLLKGIIDNPDQQVSKIPIMTESELHKILTEWNNTYVNYPKDKCVHHIFEAQVKNTPNAIAVMFEGQSITYGELNIRANRLAHYLQKLGVEPESLVGLCIGLSLDMIVGLLGILKAGGAYMPLDPHEPKERLALMLEDSKPVVILTQERFLSILPENSENCICLDSDWDSISQENPENPVSKINSSNMIYVLYTSGSTGNPKGVVVEHRQVVNYIMSIYENIGLESCNSFAMVQPLTVDACITVLLPSICNGGVLHLISREKSLNANWLGDYFRKYHIDCLKIAPSHLAALQAASNQPEKLLPKKRLVLGGEASNWNWVKKLNIQSSECVIFNHYGPTETTVGVLTYKVTKDSANHDYSITPIGKPIANTQAYVLDSHKQPVPVGVYGELYIGGANLARGYLNQSDLTNEKFITNPFSNNPEERIYKTGDMVRYLADGNIEFLGRVDNQVKIRGFRIELGEIEMAIERYPGVYRELVTVREHNGDKRIVAYIVPDNKKSLIIDDLQNYLKAKLPHYMIPSAFVIMDSLPLTPHGKVNHKSLPEPKWGQIAKEMEFIKPRTPLEEKVAEIWQKVLNLEEVGVYDNFFELGGHSLLAIQVMSRINKTYSIEMPLNSIFQLTSVADMALNIIEKIAQEFDQDKLKDIIGEIERDNRC